MEKAGFSKDVCRSMIAMMDWDRSGKLGFEEFKRLWIDIRQWKVMTNKTFFNKYFRTLSVKICFYCNVFCYRLCLKCTIKRARVTLLVLN